jgi:hypothetical protein
MPMDAATLTDAINEAGCPTQSVSVPDGTDRATWSFVPGANATQAQIDAGNNVIATIPIEPKTILTPPDFIGRFTNAEYRAATATTWRQTAGNAKNWDVVVFDPAINMNKKKVTTLKTSLVTDGILTQARADEIFQ